jgi:hypothetical protein
MCQNSKSPALLGGPQRHLIKGLVGGLAERGAP